MPRIPETYKEILLQPFYMIMVGVSTGITGFFAAALYLGTVESMQNLMHESSPAGIFLSRLLGFGLFGLVCSTGIASVAAFVELFSENGDSRRVGRLWILSVLLHLASSLSGAAFFTHTAWNSVRKTEVSSSFLRRACLLKQEGFVSRAESKRLQDRGDCL